jgi:hypothetical protein
LGLKAPAKKQSKQVSPKVPKRKAKEMVHQLKEELERREEFFECNTDNMLTK